MDAAYATCWTAVVHQRMVHTLCEEGYYVVSVGVVLATKLYREDAVKLAPVQIMVVVANTQMGLLWTEEAQGFHAEPRWFVGQSVLRRENMLLKVVGVA